MSFVIGNSVELNIVCRFLKSTQDIQRDTRYDNRHWNLAMAVFKWYESSNVSFVAQNLRSRPQRATGYNQCVTNRNLYVPNTYSHWAPTALHAQSWNSNCVPYSGKNIVKQSRTTALIFTIRNKNSNCSCKIEDNQFAISKPTSSNFYVTGVDLYFILQSMDWCFFGKNSPKRLEFIFKKGLSP